MWLPLLHTLSPSLVVVGVSAVTYRYVFSEGFFFFFFFFLTLKKKKKKTVENPQVKLTECNCKKVAEAAAWLRSWMGRCWLRQELECGQQNTGTAPCPAMIPQLRAGQCLGGSGCPLGQSQALYHGC